METDDIPLLTLSEVESGEGLEAGGFRYLHGIWVGDYEVAEQNCDSPPIFDDQMQRASSLKPNLSQWSDCGSDLCSKCLKIVVL